MDVKNVQKCPKMSKMDKKFVCMRRRRPKNYPNVTFCDIFTLFQKTRPTYNRRPNTFWENNPHSALQKLVVNLPQNYFSLHFHFPPGGAFLHFFFFSNFFWAMLTTRFSQSPKICHVFKFPTPPFSFKYIFKYYFLD
jgi:hypothetical protein